MKSLSSFLACTAAGAALLVAGPATLRADDSPSCGAGSSGYHHTATADIVDTAVGAGSFNTLVAAVKAAGLVDTLKGNGPFTVFAPTDEAFAKLPAGTVESLLADKEALTKVLTYHVVAGRVPASQVVGMDWAPTLQGQSAQITMADGNVFVDGARVVKADIETSNGIIHVIDTVILPRKDIVDTAVAAGSFNTLVTAVKAADLVETLKSKGPFTVFAPSDAAFSKLPAGTVEKLVGDKPALQNILTYHVVSGRVLSKDLEVGTTAVKTVQGQTILITRTKDGKVMVNGANVVGADVIAGNGVIHVLDSVILPKNPQ